MIQIYMNDFELRGHLRAMQKAPSKKGVAALNGVLASGTARVKAATHVQTGSLKSSVKSEGDKKFNRWEGEIEVGGLSTGVNNPVDYAIYEKARGEDHDFMTPLDLMGPEWAAAVEKGFL